MQNIALAAQDSNVDIVARVLAIVSVVIASAGIVLAWYQWRNSGPVLAADIEDVVGKERVGHPDEQWTFTVYIWNEGRMPVTVEGVAVTRLRWRWHFSWWFNWWLRLIRRDFALGNEAELREGTFPMEIPPTGYFRVKAIMDADLFDSNFLWVQAVVYSGDRRSYSSSTIRPPNHERLSRRLRTRSVR